MAKELSRLSNILTVLLLGVLLGCAPTISQTTPRARVPITNHSSASSEALPIVSKDKSMVPAEDSEKTNSSPTNPRLQSALASTGAPHLQTQVLSKPTPQKQQKPARYLQSSKKVLEEGSSEQQLLDSALEFCEAASDYWEHGELDNALDALDQAYSLILKVDEEKSPEIAQQKDDLRFTISKRVIEIYSSRFTAASGNGKEIPLVMNRYVKQAIRIFQGQERDFFLHAYRRSGKYRPAIVKALKEAGLPEELSWLPLIESGFKIRAMSRARALGLWQFIASTGYKYGLKRDRWVDERMDPEKSTAAAIAYLKELHKIFGDWTTALAAYNCGEGTVLRCIRTQHINYLDNFWDLYEKLPRETASYVPRFLAVLHILSAPETYGFTLPPTDDPVQTEKVTINKQVHLKAIAKSLHVPYQLLREINPELRFNSTPNRPYALRVPKGKGEVLLAKLKDLPVWSPPVPAYVVHRVRRGETLSGIAKRYHTSVRAIVAFNRLRSARFIRAGWKLKIPMRGAKWASVHVCRTKAKSYRFQTLKARGKPILYTVRRGDSLWSIARRFGTTTREIQSFNHLTTAQLQIGQRLLIPRGQPVAISFRTKAYKVSEGDSPFLIAQKHQMSLSEFLRLNHLTPRSTIFPGQIVLVKAD